MTVATTAAKAGPYTGNNVASSFAFAFKVFAAADVRVVETLIATDVETDLVLNTNYTVTRNADQDNNPGGSITYKVAGVTTALPSTKMLTIVGDLEYEQPTDIPNGGAWFASIIENALDRLTLLTKQLKEATDRAVKVPVSSSTNPDNLVASVTASEAAAAASAAAAAGSAAAAAAAVPLGALGYTPVNIVGDTMTGPLLLPSINVGGSGLRTSLGDVVTKTVGSAPGNVPLWEYIPTVSSIRQAVLGGPVDASGYLAPGGSTGGPSITTTGISAGAPFVVGFANGFGSNGEVNAFGMSIANLTWGGLSINGTMYLYVDYNAGDLTPGSTTLAPVYQNGGAYSTTNGQATFNIAEMVMKVGDGAAANQTNRVFVGEVTVAGGVVTAITWYAMRGRYRSATIATLPSAGTTTNFNHNLGINPSAILRMPETFGICTTIDNGWQLNEVMPLQCYLGAAALPYRPEALTGRNTAAIVAGVTNAWSLVVRSTGNNAQATPASWSYYMTVERGW